MVQPATPGHSPSSVDKSDQGGEELVTVDVMTPSTSGR